MHGDSVEARVGALGVKLDRTNRSIALSAASQTAGYMAGFAALVGLVATQT